MAFWNIEDDFADKFYQILKKLYQVYTNSFRRRRGITLSLFYEINIILMSKPDNNIIGKENYRLIYLIMMDVKIL